MKIMIRREEKKKSEKDADRNNYTLALPHDDNTVVINLTVTSLDGSELFHYY